MRRFLIGCCILAAALLVSPQAGAQDFVRNLLRGGITSDAHGAKVYGPEVMSVGELTECLLKADHLDKEAAFLTANRYLPDPVLLFDYYASEARLVLKPESQERKALVARQARERYELQVKEAVRKALYQFRSDLHDAALVAYERACSKRYYRDDLEEAKRASGLSF